MEHAHSTHSIKSGGKTGHILILLNKPFRVLCQFTGAEGRATLAEYVKTSGVYAAGRLDFDSEGLVLLTNIGRLAHLITDPKHKLPKTYLVQVEGVPDRSALEKLRKGVLLNDGMTMPAEADIIEAPHGVWPRVPPIRFRKNIPAAWLRITITEGRNRQVRRMTASVGYPALRVIRVKIGAWELEGLKPGEWKEAPINGSIPKRP
ncbi:MAG: pseudouridine synthase [Deltaproteobacteria bacterium]|nr:pseudouridine synthase [Deltaproteobacteria bacterium]